MLGKDHELLLKKVLKVFSRLNVFSLYNSKSSPKVLRFLYNRNHQIVSYNHLQQQCNRLEWFTNILCTRYGKIYLHK